MISHPIQCGEVEKIQRPVTIRYKQQVKAQQSPSAVVSTAMSSSRVVQPSRVQSTGIKPPKSYIRRQMQEKHNASSDEILTPISPSRSTHRPSKGEKNPSALRTKSTEKQKAGSSQYSTGGDSGQRGSVIAVSTDEGSKVGSTQSHPPIPRTLMKNQIDNIEELEEIAKTQKSQVSQMLQEMSEELDAAIVSRETLATQLEVMKTAYSTQEQRIARLEKQLHHSHRQRTILEVNLQDLRVTVEEQHIENDELKRSLNRAHRISPISESSLDSAETSSLPNIKMLSEAGPSRESSSTLKNSGVAREDIN